MEFKKIFDDTVSESLYKQLRDVNQYISGELEKAISKKLIMELLNKSLLPILVYPERERGVMPMHYSKQKDYQINIHTPIPDVKVLTVKEWVEFSGVGSPESFYDMIEDMKRRVEKLEF